MSAVQLRDVGRIAAVVAAAALVLAAENVEAAARRLRAACGRGAFAAARLGPAQSRPCPQSCAGRSSIDMARKRPSAAPGTTLVLEFDSRILRDNPLGDPHVRKLRRLASSGLRPVAPCAARRSGRGRRYPVLFDLVGYTGSGPAHLNWRPFDENVPERVARLTHERRIGPCIVVFPDCFTSLGGNQYINTSAMGRYADYLIAELVPFIDREFRTLASRDHRGLFGKSSGGYGAIVHGDALPAHLGRASPIIRATRCSISATSPTGRER